MGLEDREEFTEGDDEKDLQGFDTDLSPDNIINRLAAKARGLRYDVESGFYVDVTWCLIRDRYGQRL